jgi:hypothetical protein
MASGFDIRLGARIERIRRDADVTVSWSEGTGADIARRAETFDRLIVACPPGATAGVMDWSAEETRLFGLIRTTRHAVSVCETSGVPVTTAFFETPRDPGTVMAIWKPTAGSGACVFYTHPAEETPVDEIIGHIARDLPHLFPGAHSGRVLTHAEWRFFPKVDTAAFAAGFYDDFEALQGALATWYCGALPAFEILETVFAYSQALAGRMIADRRSGHRMVMERQRFARVQPHSRLNPSR